MATDSAVPPDPSAAQAAVPPALQFDALRSRALATLQRLAGTTWTDHNTHDPGITVLEQLCYAMTDLAYRSAYPVSDLMASVGGGAVGSAVSDAADGGHGTDPPSRLAGGVFSALQVLPSGPVTLDDLRRVVIDLPGVKNAWIETLQAPLARHDAAQAQLSAVPATGDRAAPVGAAPAGSASPNVTDVRPRGLYRVQIEKSGLGEDVDGGTLVRLAAQRLQQWRGLGEDIADIRVLDRMPVALDARIELAASASGAEVLAAVYQTVAQYLSPDLRLHSLREMLERGWRVDQIFEGPLLSRGFIDPGEWAAAHRRSSLRLSDLIQALMALPGVQAVKSLGFLRDGRVSSDWLLPIAADRSASFDLDGSRLRLEVAGLRIDHRAMRDSARRLYEARARGASGGPTGAPAADELAPVPGRVRPVGRYLSVQHHLPPVYGVGPNGLSDHEPIERHAQARQLKAYLLLFDQLLANQFAQLAQAGRLLSFDDDGDQVTFAQPVPDEGGALQFDRVRRQPLAEHADWLQRITRDAWGDDPDGERSLDLRHRQIDHLLARLGERWGEQRPMPAAAEAAADVDVDPAADADADADPPTDVERAAEVRAQVLAALPAAAAAAAAPPRLQALRDKQAYLRDYPRLSVRRGVGANALLGPADGAEPAGLVQRLARLLGWPGGAAALPLVEHVQLRPLPGDAFQQGPLMRAVARPDPFSLQLSLVLPAQDARFADADLRQRAERSVREEAPAHLVLRLLWLPAAPLARFSAALARWSLLRRQAQRQAFGLDEAPQGKDDRQQITLRSARNRVIDALGLGDTFPLTDLVVADGGVEGPIKVAHGRSAHIAIDAAEAGVRYELRGPDGRPLQNAQGQPLPSVAAEGADDRLVLESPPVTDNITFRVLATKLLAAPGLPPQPAVLLTQGASVKVGLDTRLALSLPDLPPLDLTLATVQPADPRLCGHGDRVRVRVHGSQEGVVYALVIDGQVQGSPVTGDLADIDLLTPPMAEDCAVAVQATKRFSAGTGGAAEQQLLDARLQVAVRADPTTALQPLPAAVLDFRQAKAVLRLSTSQASVSYQAWRRRVRDADWRREPADLADPALLHADPGCPAVAPVAAALDRLLGDGFEPLGDGPVAGNGAALDLRLAALADDAVLLVCATKLHVAGAVTVATELLLSSQALLLVRPDPAPLLQLALVQAASEPAAAVPAAAADAPTWLRVGGGQPGVAYHFAPQAGGRPGAWPAYVHQRDVLDPVLNKGLGQLALGIDLAVATGLADDPAAAAAAVADAAEASEQLAPDRRPPGAPLLDLPPLPADTLLTVRAVKVQTGVDQVLRQQARLPALPTLQVEPAVPAPGERALVQVPASEPGTSYQLWSQGRPLADPVAGTGGRLTLATGILVDDSPLWLHSLREPEDGLLPLRREQAVDLPLQPRTDGQLSARRSPVPAGESTAILLDRSQPGVLYQLSASGHPQDEPVTGSGAAIEWPSGPILADTRFSVAARRADGRGAAVALGEVVVKLQAAVIPVVPVVPVVPPAGPLANPPAGPAA